MESPAANRTKRLERSWARKFADAFRGLAIGIRGQSSFLVHFAFVAAVAVCGVIFRISFAEWLIVGLCVTVVLTAEMFNSALEHLSRAVSDQEHSGIRDALDIGSGAVLMAALGSAAIGGFLFLFNLFWPQLL